MLGRPRLLTALVAVLALLVATPTFQARGCDVCPADCPMHAARRASASAHLGCHQRSTAHAAAPADGDACAMRAVCGHHGQTAPVVFHGVLPVSFVTRPLVVARALCDARASRAPSPQREPPAEPPESFSV